MTCALCGEQITTAKAIPEVRGWAVPRQAGGTNHVLDSKKTGLVACRRCISDLKAGVTPGQGTLG